MYSAEALFFKTDFKSSSVMFLLSFSVVVNIAFCAEYQEQTYI